MTAYAGRWLELDVTGIDRGDEAKWERLVDLGLGGSTHPLDGPTVLCWDWAGSDQPQPEDEADALTMATEACKGEGLTVVGHRFLDGTEAGRQSATSDTYLGDVSVTPRVAEFDGRSALSVDGQDSLLNACVEEGMHVSRVDCSLLGIVEILAGPLTLVCHRMDGGCVLGPSRGEQKPWHPASVPFKAAIGVQPPIECDWLAGCRRA